jgi:hypothetical protein
MAMLRIAMLIMCIFLGGVGALFGLATTLGMLRSNEVSYNTPQAGSAVMVTVRRGDAPGEFWRLFALLGILPLVGGVGAAWYGWRSIKRL